MTKEERSVKAKEAAYKRQLNKINPLVISRIQHEFAATVQDNFEKHYRVGKYAQADVAKAAPKPLVYPHMDEFGPVLATIEARINTGQNMTSKESVKQDFDLALVHLRRLYRALGKALTI